jgi:hypothetical protein
MGSVLAIDWFWKRRAELGQEKEGPKSTEKAATKALNPILYEICGFTYTHIQKADISVIKTRFFGYFCLFGGFLSEGCLFAAFLAARDHDKSLGFFPSACRVIQYEVVLPNFHTEPIK